MIKLCVGADSVEDLTDWHRSHALHWAHGTTEHVTRMWPKRSTELLDAGSLYWVIKGSILARQRLLGLEERRGADGIARCALVLDAQVIRTEAALRRPFQGWRYLAVADSPGDLRTFRHGEDVLPPGMAESLSLFGVR